MIQPIRLLAHKIEVIVKDGPINRNKLDFDNSILEIKIPYLLIHQHQDSATTTKVFNISEIDSYKEHYTITKP